MQTAVDADELSSLRSVACEPEPEVARRWTSHVTPFLLEHELGAPSWDRSQDHSDTPTSSKNVSLDDRLRNFSDADLDVWSALCTSMPFTSMLSKWYMRLAYLSTSLWSVYIAVSTGRTRSMGILEEILFFTDYTLLVLGVVLAWSDRYVGAKRAIALAAFTGGIRGFITCSAYGKAGLCIHSILLLLKSGLGAVIKICGAVIAFGFVKEQGLIHLIPVCGVMSTLIGVGLTIDGNDMSQALDAYVSGFILLALWILVHVGCYRSRLIATSLLADDMRAYDEAWHQLLESQVLELDAVAKTASHLVASDAPSAPLAQDTQSLDRIFADAAIANGTFQTWVAQLAEDSGGEHVRVKIKREERALQKARRAYAEDASRLCDVVRSSIVFDDLGSLHSCLRFLDRGDVPVLRIKNRLRRDYDAQSSGGYRDVCISVSWRLPDYRRHLCEIQLQLRDMYSLKSGGGHKHYVVWRDMQGY